MVTQLLTVSATRENEVQQLVVTFTGNTTDNGVKMMADATTNAFVSLTFDSGSMNWACSDASATTSNVGSSEKIISETPENATHSVKIATDIFVTHTRVYSKVDCRAEPTICVALLFPRCHVNERVCGDRSGGGRCKG